MGTAGGPLGVADRPETLSLALPDVIKTRSIEETLLPLLNQITTLINAKEYAFKSERTLAALVKVGQVVSDAIARFAGIGQSIAHENPDIELEMRDACLDAQSSGLLIQSLTDIHNCGESSPNEKLRVIEAARQLLTAVTRVLVLADRVAVKQIVASRERLSTSLLPLEQVTTLRDFVPLFSHFGNCMVEFAHLTGDRQIDMKLSRERATMSVNRAVLERSTLILLSACKNCLRHPNSDSALKARDGVLHLMHRSVKNIEVLISQGIPVSKSHHSGDSGIELHSRTSHESESGGNSGNGAGSGATRGNTLCKMVADLIEVSTLAHCLSTNSDLLMGALNQLSDVCLDFTDSAFTSQQHRERILAQLERLQNAVHELVEAGSDTSFDSGTNNLPLSPEVSGLATRAKDTLTFLRKELEQTAIDQATELFSAGEDHALLNRLQQACISGSTSAISQVTAAFTQHAEQLQEASKLLHHISAEDGLETETEHIHHWVLSLAPLVLAAGGVVQHHPSSHTAVETFNQFSETWHWSVSEFSRLVKLVSSAANLKLERQVYLSLPRPGKHGATARQMKPLQRLDSEERAKVARTGFEMKLLTSQLEAQTSSMSKQPRGTAAVDIGRHARSLSSLAVQSYQFTRGEGALRTTQDLFNNSEFIVQEGLVLYGYLRDLMKQLPPSTARAELESLVSGLPALCHQLHFTLKTATAGKAATFNKVDTVILETKNLMQAVNEVVTITNGHPLPATTFQQSLPSQVPSLARFPQKGAPPPQSYSAGSLGLPATTATTSTLPFRFNPPATVPTTGQVGSYSMDVRALMDPSS